MKSGWIQGLVGIDNELVAHQNTLQIRLTNTWNNRLVADGKLPEAKRRSHVAQGYRFNAKSPLHQGGLLGPVRVKQEKWIPGSGRFGIPSAVPSCQASGGQRSS